MNAHTVTLLTLLLRVVVLCGAFSLLVVNERYRGTRPLGWEVPALALVLLVLSFSIAYDATQLIYAWRRPVARPAEETDVLLVVINK
jgi:hypothetical protein